MSEIEQLRKELNELRERIAVLEKRPMTAPVSLLGIRPDSPLRQQPPQPQWLSGTLHAPCYGRAE